MIFSFEETGEEHVEDLVRRNLVLVRKRKSNGRIKSIQMQNSTREFCLRQAHIDNFFLHVSLRNGFDGQSVVATELHSSRRVSAYWFGDVFYKCASGSTVRTILLNYSIAQGVKFSIGNVRLLRILDLSNANNRYFPEEVFDLFHLRYLENLENLQTLIICPRENGGMFDKLPEEIWRMPQLRHLVLFRFELPTQIGATTSALENLQTLSRVVDFICSRQNLKMIPNLRKLAIFYSNNSRDAVEDYELHNLIYLHKLEILKLEMNWSFVGEHKMDLALPPTLKKLNLCGLKLPWEDMKIVASLPNLQVLKLRSHACFGETWETSEGGFPQLTYLLIEECNLKNWITESSHFPRLKCVVLRCCLHLSEFPDDMVKVPTLKCIELDDQNPLLPSTEQIRQHRKSLGYDPLYISAKTFQVFDD